MAVKYKDYYEILGVERASSQGDIRKAYRKLAKQYHPDISKEKNADARYKEINEAYEVLKDPDKRAKYDTLGAGWQQGQDFTPPPDWRDVGGPRSEYSGEWDSFSDFFKTVFGGVGFENVFAGTQAGQRRRVIPRDSEVELELSLEDAARGGIRTFSYRSPGLGTTQSINVKLPRGIIDGSRIRLPDKAPEGGDIYVTLRIASHPVFTVEGHNLTRSLKIEPWQAVLGGAVSVSTLDGSVDVKVPPGIQNGQKLRLKGKGLPMRDKDNNGDLYVRIEVVMPRHLTERQKELWEELASLETPETK
jgi:curved DNA-binding protein